MNVTVSWLLLSSDVCLLCLPETHIYAYVISKFQLCSEIMEQIMSLCLIVCVYSLRPYVFVLAAILTSIKYIFNKIYTWAHSNYINNRKNESLDYFLLPLRHYCNRFNCLIIKWKTLRNWIFFFLHLHTLLLLSLLCGLTDVIYNSHKNLMSWKVKFKQNKKYSLKIKFIVWL